MLVYSKPMEQGYAYVMGCMGLLMRDALMLSLIDCMYGKRGILMLVVSL